MKRRAVNINKASAKALEVLPLIGPKRAARIIKFRRVNGYFRTVEELDLVPGIGKGIVNRLVPLITV